MTTNRGTVDEGEIARFASIADEWWDPNGRFKPLHRLNPVRLDHILAAACDRFARNPTDERPLEGLCLLDVGCGGGLLTEPLALAGADALGIDAGEKTVGVATAHAAKTGAPVRYARTTVEQLADEGRRFDIVLAMEIVEHVADLDLFLAACRAVLDERGVIFFATINRTLKSWAGAIVGAERVLRWLPRGTHDWNKFVRPSELVAACARAGLVVRETTGVVYNPLTGGFRISARDLGINYMVRAERSR